MNSNNSQKAVGWLLGVAAILVAVVFLVVIAREKYPSALTYEGNMLDAGAKVVSALLVVTLLVERSVAALFALVFGERERRAELALMSADAPTRAEGLTRLAEALELKERFRILLTFAAGLFVSAAGARTLDGLLNWTTPPPPEAPNLFLYPVDIVLTAGLIAGGSNALAYLLEYLKNLLKQPPGQVAEARMRLMTTS